MFKGDRSRKSTLAEYGFRLPSCMDNRPLKFEEWDAMRTQTIFVSATPGPWELDQTKGKHIDQVIRPTGLIDPIVEIRPAKNQVDDLMHECKEVVKGSNRVLVTTLTKKMAEDLTEYLHENGIKVRYLHSDIDTLERIEIMRDLRMGVFDVLVGINLLREGLDIPECALVGILDADKEGFLRSETSLIQTIGRAARNVDGKVILYADKETKSIKKAVSETNRRREIQLAYNKKNNIDAKSVKKEISDILESVYEKDYVQISEGSNIGGNLKKHLKGLNKRMKEAASNLEFEEAAKIRDEIRKLESTELEITLNPKVKQYDLKNKLYPKGRSTMGMPGTKVNKKRDKTLKRLSLGKITAISKVQESYPYAVFSMGNGKINNSGTLEAVNQAGGNNAYAVSLWNIFLSDDSTSVGYVPTKDYLNLYPGSHIIGGLDLGGGEDEITFKGGHHNLTFSSSYYLATEEALEGIKNADFSNSDIPWVRSGQQVAAYDPTIFAGQAWLLQSMTREISSLKSPASVWSIDGDQSVVTQQEYNDYRVWIKGFGGERDENDSTYTLSYNNQFGGFALGVEREFEHDLLIQGFGGAVWGSTNLSHDYGDSDMDLGFFGLSVSKGWGDFNINAALQSGTGDLDVSRKTNNNLDPSGWDKHLSTQLATWFAHFGHERQVPRQSKGFSLNFQKAFAFANDHVPPYDNHDLQ